MMKNAGVAVGAGLASALLFMGITKGSVIGALIGTFTVLPLMIAVLSYGHLPGLAAAAVGSIAVAAISSEGPIVGAAYALILALPAWWLACLLTWKQARPSTTEAGSGQSDWLPISWVVLWAAGLSSAIAITIGVIVSIRMGGYSNVLAAATRRVVEQWTSPDNWPPVDDPAHYAGYAAKVMLLCPGPMLLLMLLANLWLGGRVSQISQRLPRPWPNVPDGLRLPHFAVLLLACCGGVWALAALGDGVNAAGGTVGVTLALAFAMQGLGTAHVLTRGFTGRAAILSVIYVVTVTLSLVVAGLAVLGVVDTLVSLRSRRSSPPNPPTKAKGLSPWT